jgi:hypothetical protein
MCFVLYLSTTFYLLFKNWSALHKAARNNNVEASKQNLCFDLLLSLSCICMQIFSFCFLIIYISTYWFVRTMVNAAVIVFIIISAW